MKALFFSLVLIFTFSACFDQTEDEFNDVFIRLENLTGEDLTDIILGRRIYKSVNSYKSVDYSTEIDNLANNEMTAYFNTKGKFNGYSQVRGHIDNDPLTWSGEQREEALVSGGAVPDTWDNPFSDAEREGFSLSKGNYTFKINLNENGTSFNIDIEAD